MTPLGELLGDSPGMTAIRSKLERLLQHQSEGRRLPPVLLQGETGTGKTELARAMHRMSARRDGPIIDVNCPAITETLQESAFFGHERGAFTDARQARPGYFQLAHRGTMFLDEVALLSDSLQGMLLKAIEEKTVRRVGGARSEAVDVWVIAASNVDLAAATRDRRFREDLYHRLAVVTVTMPPLRERGADIGMLAEHFLQRACVDYGLAPKRLDPGARAALLAYDWPGNVRQLARLMERVAMLADATVVTSDMLELPAAPRRRPPVHASTPSPSEPGTVAREDMLEALEQTSWNLMQAARRLGIPRNTLRHRMTKAGLQRGAHATASPPPPRETATSSPAPDTEIPVYAGIRWEPRRLTVLRVALTSTSPDRARSVGRGLEVAADKVRAFGGRVVERSPTGLVAAFGLEPVEDAPRRAVHAAIAIRNPAARARAEDDAVAVKIAIHVGRFEVGFGGGAPEIELEAKHAAWAVLETFLAHADTDTVVVSEAAATFLDRRFHLAPIDAGSGPAYRLVGHERPGFGIGRRISAFVGRRHHVDLLGEHLRAAMGGQGQVIGIVGEAGIGKSRLIGEFRQSLAGGPAVYREGTCFSYASAIPYLPVISILKQTCAIRDSDRAETIIAKVRRSLEELGMSADAGAPYLLRLFAIRDGTEPLASLAPEAVRLRTVDTLRQMMLIASRQRPLVFVIEDLHWIDKTSEEVFASLVTDLPGAAVMFVATYRPGYRPPWSGQSFASQISLSPLSPEDSLMMVRALLPEVPEPLARMIRDKAEGNPFFLEELCHAIEAHGNLDTNPAVPDTIEAVLLARIDGLPDEPRTVLQTAAVLGREFSSDLLQATWDGAGSLDAHLALLTGREFLYQRVAGGAPAYVFKHALTQEVAYAGLSAARRQALHTAAGRALETLLPDRLEEAYDRLAYHYSKTAEAAKAVDYLDRFAQRAARGDAHDEAVQAWTEALQHVERLPDDVRDRRHLEIVLRLPYSLLRLGRIHAISTLLLDEGDRLERLQDAALAANYYYLLARASIFGGHVRAVGYVRRSIAEAERCGDEVMMGKAYGVLALAGALFCEAPRGIEDAHRAVSLLENTKEKAGLCYAYWALGLCYSQTGDFHPALVAEDRALAIAVEIGDQPLEAYSIWVMGLVHAAMGEWEQGIDECRRAMAKTRDPFNYGIISGFLGFAYLEKGEARQAIDILEQAIAFLRQVGFRAMDGWFTAFLAEAHRLEGDLDRAESLAAEAIAIATEASFPLATGWARQTLGRSARTRGDLPAAAARFEEALAIFVETHSRYESARTHMELATVAWARGDPATAARQLQDAHAQFEALAMPRYGERVRALAAEWGTRLDPS